MGWGGREGCPGIDWCFCFQEEERQDGADPRNRNPSEITHSFGTQYVEWKFHKPGSCLRTGSDAARAGEMELTGRGVVCDWCSVLSLTAGKLGLESRKRKVPVISKSTIQALGSQLCGGACCSVRCPFCVCWGLGCGNHIRIGVGRS